MPRHVVKTIKDLPNVFFPSCYIPTVVRCSRDLIFKRNLSALCPAFNKNRKYTGQQRGNILFPTRHRAWSPGLPSQSLYTQAWCHRNCPLIFFQSLFLLLLGKVRRCLVLKLLSLQFVTLLKEPEHSPEGKCFIPHASLLFCCAWRSLPSRSNTYSFMTTSNRNWCFKWCKYKRLSYI